jgi:hypothetical protein
VKANSVQELIALAKASPGKLTFASSSVGAAPHLAGELLKRMAGIDIVHVPYKGSGPATTDLIGGHVTMMMDSMPSSIAHVKSGSSRCSAYRPRSERHRSRIADDRGIASRIRHRDVVRRLGASEDAEGDRQQGLERNRERTEARRPERAPRRTRRGGRRQHARGVRRLLRERIQRWAKVVKDSGAKLD